MKAFKLVALLASFTVGGGIYAGEFGEQTNIDVTATITVVACGPHSSCPVTVTGGKTNAIGQVIRIDVTKEPVTSLIPKGETEIKEEKTQFLDMPKAGGVKVYSFIPSEGELKGKRIYVAFDDIETGRGRLAGKIFIRILRQLEGDNPYEWLEAGELTGEMRPARLSFTLEPDGTLSTIAGKTKQKTTFGLGKKVLGA